MNQAKQSVEYVHARRIPQFAEGVDRIVRPKRYSVRESSDQRDVERKVAEIIGRLNLKFTSVDIEQPYEGPQCKQSKKCCDQPEPNFTVAPGPLGRSRLSPAWLVRVRCAQ